MKKLMFFFMLSQLSVWLFAASSDFHFRHLSVEDGLSSNSINSIIQDKQGFLWFGTDDGLNRYDGTTIKFYPIDPHGTGKYITALHETQHHIWIGTDDGAYLYDPVTEKFTRFTQRTSNGISIHNTVNHISEDKDGNIWLSTNEQGLFRYALSNQQLDQFEFKDASGFIAHTLVDSNNQIWAVSNQGKSGLYKLNKANDSFEPFTLAYSNQEHQSHALTLLEDSEHNLWLGTWKCGLQKIDRYTKRVSVYFLPSEQMGATHIHSLMEYAPHQLLIGSDDGLLLFDTHTEEYKLFTEDETSPHAISNRFVYPLCKDREGGVWIGTYYGGVNYISPKTTQFESFTHSHFHNSIGGRVIGRFCEDMQGRIWIASDDAGLSCYTPNEQRFTHYLSNESHNSISYHNVHALCLDGNNLWIGTYTGGINVLNLKTKRFKTYQSLPDHPNTLYDNSSYAIFKDRSGKIWVSSMIGINLYNPKTDNFTRIKKLNVLTIDIDQDTKGNLWFSTQGKGLFKYHPEKQIWKNYTHSNKDQSTLPSNQVNCCLTDSNGTLWIGTMNGLCQYDTENDCFKTIPLQIPSQNICCIIEDQHILWLTTTKGLVRYTPGEGCRVFTKSDGLQSEQFIANAGIKTTDGKIYVGSVNGFNAFYPHQIKTNQIIPPAILTGLEIFNKTIPVGDKRLPNALSYTKELELSYKDNVFSLVFASLSYDTPSKNKYAYILEGFDKEWNYVDSQNKATYTNLPAGKYTFRIKASNNDGVWNKNGQSLTIIIHPPFYWTTFAKICYVLIICFLIIIGIRAFIKHTERKHTEEIDRLNKTKEKEVHEAKIKFFTMIAHEIRTPVSLIIGPLEKIMKADVSLPLSVQEDLNIINRNSQRLLSLVNQLLDFRKVEQQELTLKFTQCNICQVLKAVCERFEPTMTQQEISLQTEYPSSDFIAIVDHEALTKLISNLLTNAIKYTKSRILVSCMICPTEQTFTLVVTDDGMGISPNEQTKIFRPFYQIMDNKPGTGIGLSIVKSIVESHHGHIEVKSEINHGASFIVTLPIGQPDTSLTETIMNESNSPIDTQNGYLNEMSNQSANKPIILIVEDNPDMNKFLAENFSEHYQTLVAEDGIEAWEQIQESGITLIICDWMMPRMNGVELCKKIRADQSTSHIPFILLTAKTDTDSKIEGMDCGADIYIEKPFSIQYLEACIKNLLDMRTLLREKFSQMPLAPLNSIAHSTVDDNFLTRLNSLIEENFSNPELSVDFLAEHLCISRSGLFAKIKTLANITPNELIQLIRLKKAATLLAENKYRINEICYMVGFNNPSYFAKCFQKQFGMKPGEFMARSKNE